MERVMPLIFDNPFARSRPSASNWIALPSIQGPCYAKTLQVETDSFRYSRVVNDSDKFGVEISNVNFHPDELSVRAQDGLLVLEGCHEERDKKAGYIKRRFIRRYAVPEEVNIKSLESQLSEESVLSVYAEKHNDDTLESLISSQSPELKEATSEESLSKQRKRKFLEYLENNKERYIHLLRICLIWIIFILFLVFISHNAPHCVTRAIRNMWLPW